MAVLIAKTANEDEVQWSSCTQTHLRRGSEASRLLIITVLAWEMN